MHSLAEVRMRKAELTLRIATQRLSLGSQLNELQPLFGGVDKGIGAVKALAHAWPLLSLVGALAFARLFRPPRRSLTIQRSPGTASLWLRRGLLAWRAWSLVRPTIRAYLESRQQASALRHPWR